MLSAALALRNQGEEADNQWIRPGCKGPGNHWVAVPFSSSSCRYPFAKAKMAKAPVRRQGATVESFFKEAMIHGSCGIAWRHGRYTKQI